MGLRLRTDAKENVLATAEEYWNLIEPVVKEHDLELFDMDLPGVNSKVLRVYIWHGVENKEPVTVGSCAQISKALGRMPEFEEYLPESSILEVASPGINRRLRRPEHFLGALGERMKLTVTGLDEESPTKKDTVVGVLRAFEEETLSFEMEPENQLVSLPLNEVHKARIDFDFK